MTIRKAKLIYCSVGIIIFVIVPSCIFMYTEDWTFITALYFAVTSLAKIGFGDYVPRAHPPEEWARRADKFDLGECVEAIVEESTRTFNVKRTPIDVSSKAFCQPTRWDNIYWLGYWVYRFLVYLWQLTGLSFSGTMISMIVKKLQQVIPEMFPCLVVDSERPFYIFPSPYNRSLCVSRTEISPTGSPMTNKTNGQLLQLIPQNCALSRQPSYRTQKSDSGVASAIGTPYNRRKSLSQARGSQETAIESAYFEPKNNFPTPRFRR
ncbi:Oidioi.mRNA.OKI2018_I69.chr2.g6803.t1.cds [Oikopleura dioica]|uniref:Oidioi.mRNA.OKI2018_I69.chr2.g6803.t1.cds n=1 Tax=Oikopleura dioica TaxID=34765 RepID=A0ABN7T4L7_OIKDI|nr:Oidioi.mRNA.OKI2018_I69.chr2.g6803.t1.cds [Oikopleura dioica]